MDIAAEVLFLIATATGAGAAAGGAVKSKKASDKMKELTERSETNQSLFDRQYETTMRDMDKLGRLELEILDGFDEYSRIIKRIHNMPEFEAYSKDGVTIPKLDKQEMEKVSVQAGVLLGGLGGAALGTAGGFAASGATISIVMSFGAASTGTAISSLSGAAAVNATLAAIGGGSLAAGGGGVALGSTILSFSTMAVGVLVGGIIFNATGKKLSAKADEAERQVLEAEDNINEICAYLRELSYISERYFKTLTDVRRVYKKNLLKCRYMMQEERYRNWSEISENDRLIIKNTTMLVGLLYKMCGVSLAKFSEDGINRLNKRGAETSMKEAKSFIYMMEEA